MSVRVQREDFDSGAEIAALGQGCTEVGAVASFVGLVRDQAGDKRLIAMTLEHYPGMAERQLQALVAQAQARWPLLGVTVIHRYGRLLPGDRIVLVAVASAHRRAAFEACEFLMDWLKTRAPFWKLEETATGEAWVPAKDDDDRTADRWHGVA